MEHTFGLCDCDSTVTTCSVDEIKRLLKSSAVLILQLSSRKRFSNIFNYAFIKLYFKTMIETICSSNPDAFADLRNQDANTIHIQYIF